MSTESEKESAARRSVDFVKDGQVVGLGTGSTAAYAVDFLGSRVRAGLKIRAIPTSTRTREQAAGLGIPLTTLEESPAIDVTIDGADEIDPGLGLIKGGGGALLGEKVIASFSRLVVIIADSKKRVQALGKFPLPVEVMPFAAGALAGRIAKLGATVKLREKSPAGGPFVTDGGHYILDCSFGRIEEPGRLAAILDGMPGVVEHGLFLGIAGVVLVGEGDRVLEFCRKK